MPYKRSSPISYAFPVTHFEPVFWKPEFFNTYSCSRQLNSADSRLLVIRLASARPILHQPTFGTAAEAILWGGSLFEGT